MNDIPNIQIGIIAHGGSFLFFRTIPIIFSFSYFLHIFSDYCDGPAALTSLDLSNDAARICEFVNTVTNTGGGDSPEAYELVLREARHLHWREGSSRALVLIGDDVPHAPSYTTERISWLDELDHLCEAGVKVYGVSTTLTRCAYLITVTDRHDRCER